MKSYPALALRLTPLLCAHHPHTLHEQRRGAPGWSPSLRIDDGPTGTWQGIPRIAADPSGSLYVVWQDNRAGDMDVRLSELPAGHVNWVPSVRVNEGSFGQQAAPDVAADRLVTVHVVWEDSRNGPKDFDIYWRSRAAAAEGWDAERKISDDPGNAPQHGHSVTATRKGSACVVWEDGRNDDGTPPANDDIYFALKRSGAARWSRSFRLNTDPGAANQAQPRIATDWDGNGYVVWQDFRVPGAAPDIFSAFLSSPETRRVFLPWLLSEG